MEKQEKFRRVGEMLANWLAEATQTSSQNVASGDDTKTTAGADNNKKKKKFAEILNRMSSTNKGLNELNSSCDKIIAAAEEVNRNLQPNEKGDSDGEPKERDVDELKAENRVLKIAIEDNAIGLEMIMKKYREDVTVKVLDQSVDFRDAELDELWQKIGQQRTQITQMAEVMRKAAAIDEENMYKHIEEMARLRYENKSLRELVDISKQYGSFGRRIRLNDHLMVDKAVQTDKVKEGKSCVSEL